MLPFLRCALPGAGLYLYRILLYYILIIIIIIITVPLVLFSWCADVLTILSPDVWVTNELDG